MREAVAPGGQEDAIGVTAGVGLTVGVAGGADGGADGCAETVPATVAVGLAATLEIGLAGGRVITTIAAGGAVLPAPKGGRPSMAVATTTRARTTSPTPTIDSIGSGFRGSVFAWVAGVSFASRVPRT
jgi:hypothetical protein